MKRKKNFIRKYSDLFSLKNYLYTQAKEGIKRKFACERKFISHNRAPRKLKKSENM